LKLKNKKFKSKGDAIKQDENEPNNNEDIDDLFSTGAQQNNKEI